MSFFVFLSEVCILLKNILRVFPALFMDLWSENAVFGDFRPKSLFLGSWDCF